MTEKYIYALQILASYAIQAFDTPDLTAAQIRHMRAKHFATGTQIINDMRAEAQGIEESIETNSNVLPFKREG